MPAVYADEQLTGTQPSVSMPTSSPEPDASTAAEVKRWLARIECSKKRFKDDFARMREDMKFCYGLQWEKQKDLSDCRYQANQVLRMVNQKVATLYAKNPTAEVTLRPRMYYQLWDGDVTSLMERAQEAAQILESGEQLPPELSDFFADVQAGRERKKLVEKVAKTLELTYQYFVDAQKPDFIAQAKQMVRRAVICGVAYVHPILCVNQGAYETVSSIEYGSDAQDLAHRAQNIMRKAESGEINKSSADIQTLRSLTMSLGASASPDSVDSSQLPVRLEFDFPPATSIIVDERCRNLEEFIAARWIAQEYRLPVAEVNEIFGTNIKTGSGPGQVQTDPLAKDNYESEREKSGDPMESQFVNLYKVWDKSTKTCFYLCEGWKDYVTQPESVQPEVSGFWQHFALVFNSCEYEDECGGSIYPPSDVRQVVSPQREWIRTRDALRDQRNANAPKYLVRKGLISDSDKERLQCAAPNSVVELDSVPMDQPLEKFIVTLQMAPVDEKLYDTTPLEQDILIAGGMQQANIGPAQPNVTATVGTIAEQSRMTVSSSNVDDLDGVLSRLAQASGEMLLRAFPAELTKRTAGPGAVFPGLEASREDFLNEILLRIKAASSGRPNKAVDIANYRDLAPIMLQAGANPVGVIEEGARRLGDDLDVTRFFPVMPQAPQGQPGEKPSNQSAQNQTGSQPSGLRRPPQNVAEEMGNPQDNTVELPRREIGALQAASSTAA